MLVHLIFSCGFSCEILGKKKASNGCLTEITSLLYKRTIKEIGGDFENKFRILALDIDDKRVKFM